MKQAWRVCSEPTENFPQGSERELAFALVDDTDACFGRLFGGCHKPVDYFLFARIEMPAVVDLNELGIHVAGVFVHKIMFFNPYTMIQCTITDRISLTTFFIHGKLEIQ